MSKQTYESYYKDYNKRNNKRISLNLSKEKDADIIKALDGKNIQASIKGLIRDGLRNK